MKKLLVLLALLVFQQGFAQVSPHPYHGTISTAGSDCSVATRCVTVTIPPETASATIAVDATTGSWSGTIQFEGSVDGTIWIAMVPTSNSSSTSSSTTSTGVWQFNPSSYIKIRARASARASGTAPILINWSNATASNGSSAGGGTPGGSDTYVQFNDGGAFGGDATFNFNKSTKAFSVDHINTTGTASPDTFAAQADPGPCTDGQFWYSSTTAGRLKWCDTATARTVGLMLASGTATLGTGAIASGACASAVTVAATGAATTDIVSWTPNADISAVTGYAPVTTGGLMIFPYVTSGNVNFKVCNPTSSSITPGAVTLNWRVTR